MEHKKVGDTYLMRMEKGDEIIPTLAGFAREMGIGAASITAIGALTDPEIAYYDLPAKEYRRRTFEGPHEMVALTGNIGMRDGEPLVHLHVVIGAPDYTARAGHLFGGTITATGEFFIRPVDTVIERRLVPEIGLPLWDLGGSGG